MRYKLFWMLVGLILGYVVAAAVIIPKLFTPDLLVFSDGKYITLEVGDCITRMPKSGIMPGTGLITLGAGGSVSTTHGSGGVGPTGLEEWTMSCGEYTVTWTKAMENK